ncbi:MAG: zinc-dependent metalloprotease family protein [Dehalococcoidia bacterium]|nr:zinc-dependent metalloprotease family protein [Dehalococcoidia bacterium]
MRMRLARKLVSALLAAAVVSLAFIPSVDSHAYAGDLLVPESWRSAHPGPFTIRVTLLVDEEWTALYGPRARGEAAAALDDAAARFENAGIHIELARYETWQSDGDAGSMGELLSAVKDIPPGESDVIVALTAQYHGRIGGISDQDRRHLLVKHHPYRTDLDSFVLAHEMGHALGLDHHHCPHHYCLMSDHDYDPAKHWCPDHLRLLRANAGYFQYAGGTAPPG